jgi:hypothetical protein
MFTTEAEAEERQRVYPPFGYHVRPVEVCTRVLGAPPEPWCFRASTPFAAPATEER